MKLSLNFIIFLRYILHSIPVSFGSCIKFLFLFLIFLHKVSYILHGFSPTLCKNTRKTTLKHMQVPLSRKVVPCHLLVKHPMGALHACPSKLICGLVTLYFSLKLIFNFLFIYYINFLLTYNGINQFTNN